MAQGIRRQQKLGIASKEAAKTVAEKKPYTQSGLRGIEVFLVFR
jgi:hypothetical protein